MSNKCRFSANSHTHLGMPTAPSAPSAAAQAATQAPPTIQSLTEKVERIEVAMGAWSTASMTQQQQIADVKSDLQSLRAHMDHKFQQVDEKIEKLDEKIEKLDEKIEMILIEIRSLKNPPPLR